MSSGLECAERRCIAGDCGSPFQVAAAAEGVLFLMTTGKKSCEIRLALGYLHPPQDHFIRFV